MSRRTRAGVIPGRQFVAINVVCEPCQAGGLYRRIGRFGRYTYPGADPEPWVEGWGPPSRRPRPQWTPAPGGSETVHLVCPEGHHRPVRKERIIAGLDAIPLPAAGEWRAVDVAL